MEAITDTAIINAADYRADDEKADRPITFDPEAMAKLAAHAEVQGVPFIKLRIKSDRPCRPLGYTEHLEQGYRICLTAPGAMSTPGLQSLLNASLSAELAKIAGQETLVVTDMYDALVVTAGPTLLS